MPAANTKHRAARLYIFGTGDGVSSSVMAYKYYEIFVQILPITNLPGPREKHFSALCVYIFLVQVHSGTLTSRGIWVSLFYIPSFRLDELPELICHNKHSKLILRPQAAVSLLIRIPLSLLSRQICRTSNKVTCPK
jgi:hypothetical protein